MTTKAMRELLALGLSLASSAGALGIIDAQAADGPLHGRPRYETIDGKEWIFYRTQANVDWYLAPRGELDGDIFKILIRGVSPGTDNYGPLQIDCKKKLYSSYYEPWEKIPTDSALINGLYRSHCNLRQAY